MVAPVVAAAAIGAGAGIYKGMQDRKMKEKEYEIQRQQLAQQMALESINRGIAMATQSINRGTQA